MKHLSLARVVGAACVIIITCMGLTSISAEKQQLNIGLLIVATGRYIQFVEPLVVSARKHFCADHKVTYFIFTDGAAPVADDIVSIHQNRLGWPYDTMMRFAMYDNSREKYKNMDYLFACDSDMLFVEKVGDEILGERVATQHPGYVGQRGTYEERGQSLACIARHEGKHYFAGGFYGGQTQEFLTMVHTARTNIETDLKRGIIAVWHDESHLNRYFVDHEPTVILTPSYCYPEELHLNYTKRLLAICKNHAQMRQA